MSQTILHASVLLADIIGVTIIVMGLFREHQQFYPSWHKVGLIVMAVGMLGQGVQSLQYLIFGIETSVFVLPVWAFKDYSVAIICAGYAWLAHQQFVQARTTATQEVAQAIAATSVKRRGRPPGSTSAAKTAPKKTVKKTTRAKR